MTTAIGGATCFTQQVLAVWSDGKSTSSGAVRTQANGIIGGGRLQERRQKPGHGGGQGGPVGGGRDNAPPRDGVKRSTSVSGIAKRFTNGEDDHRTRVFNTGTRTESGEMPGARSANHQQRSNNAGNQFIVDMDDRNIRPLEQLRKQLDQLEDSRDTSSIVRILREQIEEMEKGNKMRKCDHHHHHHHHNHQQQQQKSSSSKGGGRKTEERGVQADWALLMETEAELIGPTQQRLSAPELTKTRQRIGSGSSRSHSAEDDDDDSNDDVTGGGADERRHRAELKMADDRLMTSRLREANLLAHLKDYRSRAEDLRRLISLRDGHIGRLEDEISRLKVALVEGRGKEKEMQSFISDLQLTLADLHAKYEEYVVLGQLRDSERTQLIDSLEKQVAKLTEEKHNLTFGHPVIGSKQQQQQQQQQQHLSKSDSHFQSTGCLVPDESPVSLSSDKTSRGHRSVESSPSSSGRCLRHSDAINESSDPDAEEETPPRLLVPEGSSSSSSAEKKKKKTRRSCSVVNGPAMPSHGRNDRKGSDAVREERPNAAAVSASDDASRPRGGGGCGGPRASSIPRNSRDGADGVQRTRSLVRKPSYIFGIQEHSMLDQSTLIDD